MMYRINDCMTTARNGNTLICLLYKSIMGKCAYCFSYFNSSKDLSFGFGQMKTYFWILNVSAHPPP